MPDGGVPGLPVHAFALRHGHGEDSLRRPEQRLGVVLGDQAVLFMMTEAAISDAVQGQHETARSHCFEGGQIESLSFARQTHGDPALAKQCEERAPVKEFADQQVLDARCVQSFGQRPGKLRALVADDGDWPAALVEPRR